MERKIRAGDTLLGRESDEDEVDSESGEESEEEEEQPKTKKTKKEPVGEVQPRAVKEAKRDKKEQPQNEVEDAERNLAKKAIVNKKRKRLLERIEKVFESFFFHFRSQRNCFRENEKTKDVLRS